MLARPDPRACEGSNPTPSSSTRNVRSPFDSARLIRAPEAFAYLAMFCIASRTQKYTAASISCGYRPMPSMPNSTGSVDLRAWASSAAPRPASASSGG